jgi:hypothetical protein
MNRDSYFIRAHSRVVGSADFQSAVSRISNPLGARSSRRASRLATRDTADWKSALLSSTLPTTRECARHWHGGQNPPRCGSHRRQSGTGEEGSREGLCPVAILRSFGGLLAVAEASFRVNAGQIRAAFGLADGEQQMLALGRALMDRPKLLLLDEPSMGLAPLMAKDVFAEVLKMKDLGVTVLLVEQNAMATLQIADRAYVMETGEILLEGPAADLLHNPEVSVEARPP